MKISFYKKGMTLVEVLMVVAVVAMLGAFLIPAITTMLRQADNASAASQMRQAVSAFELYCSEHGSYPEDKNPGQTPPEMVAVFADMGIDEWWASSTDVGGRWDWDEGYHFAYSVSIAAPTASSKQMTRFDALVDDGDLSTGKFRAIGSQHHYIIEE